MAVWQIQLLGGLRASAQMISYEIAMGLSLIGVVMTFGTLDLQAAPSALSCCALKGRRSRQ